MRSASEELLRSYMQAALDRVIEAVEIIETGARLWQAEECCARRFNNSRRACMEGQ